MATASRVKEVDPNAPKTFSYLAVSPSGERIKNKMVAPKATAVSAVLQQEGFIPLEVKEIPTGGVNMDLSGWLTNRPLKLKIGALASFTRQFHQLLRAGLSVPKAMAAVGEEQDPRLIEMTQTMSDKTASGISLSQAFSEYPSCFDDVYVSYIAAGEETGELVETTNRLSKMLDKRAQLALKIKGVTAYPKMVSMAIAAIVVLILLFLVPMYADIYAGFGAPLPTPTRILVAISNSLWPFAFWSPLGDMGFPFSLIGLPYPKPTSPTLYMIAAYIAFRYWLKRTKDDLDIGERLDRIKFKLPVFGKLNAYTSMFRWVSTLAGALHSGMQMSPALDLAARASGSRWQMKVCEELKDGVRSGKPLSEVMSRHKDLYSPNIRAMIKTGEDAGELSTMLDSVAQSIDDEIDAVVAGLGAKIEVALLLVMGIVVGGLLVVLYLPILNLAATAGEGLSEGSF